LSVQSITGTITTLNCSSATNTGILTAGTVASGVSSSVPYTGGNGGTHNGQTVTSTGVTGLTATLTAGTFASGNGSLTYTISGTPSASGTASFALNIGGQTCTLNVIVYGVQPAFPTGTVYCNSIVTIVNDVTNPTTGKTWMDRNLGASQVATSSTDAASYGDLYQWGRRSDGHQCRNSATSTALSSTDQPTNGNFIVSPNTPYDWRNPQNTNLWQGVNGVNNPCPSGYRIPTSTELNSERLSWVSNDQNGAMISALKLPLSGRRFQSTGNLLDLGISGNYYSSTTNSTYVEYLLFQSSSNSATNTISNRSMGMTARCIKEIIGSIGALNCGSSTLTGNLISGSAATGVSVTVPYTSGNGGTHNGQTVSSTGVTGLTATLTAGTFAVGLGSLTYTITGTPSASGTASFALNIGGQTCTVNLPVYGPQPAYPTGTVHCNSIVTIVNDVTNLTTGKTWMDRNLGATQVATSSTDAAAYGDLYQWGRGSDGHQCRNSLTTTTLSSVDQPGNGNFIIPSSLPYDWRNPQNNTLWQGANGINNPCPSGYRLPTDTELDSDRLSWNANNSSGAFASPLKLPLTGYRNYGTAVLTSVNSNAYYWTSTISSSATGSNYLVFNSTSGSITSNMRANGMAIRCIKETIGSIGALNCSSATLTGNLISGTAASGVSVSIPYTGGNGGFYSAQNISSTGVTGLTASITQGLLASGSGNLVYTISGTPSASGTAIFALNVGGKTCDLNIIVYSVQPAYPTGTVYCNSIVTIVNNVTNPTTGKTWMDRNLGATQVATSSTDAAAYGDLYQWGRGSDGHQCRNSTTTTTLSSADQPGHGNFILAPSSPCNWRSPENINLWQGVNGVNNPCPNGYRLPTETELNNERASWSANNATGAFNSNLKLPLVGRRLTGNGSFTNLGDGSYYWTSTIIGLNSRYLSTGSTASLISTHDRGGGLGVRCIKN
jgi:uncharacterized protein (TIGR02145 family)